MYPDAELGIYIDQLLEDATSVKEPQSLSGRSSPILYFLPLSGF